MIQCNLCDQWFLAYEIEEHLVVVHDSEPIERWSDGGVVMVDTTLEPWEFE
jgi:hypothetical protein